METSGSDRVLVDTSVWIEFFRGVEPFRSSVLALMQDRRICCAGVILAELLQGAKSENEVSVLRDFAHVFEFLPESVAAWERAGVLSFNLRRKGRTAGLADCYLAVLASEAGAQVFSRDVHFRMIGEELGLALLEVDHSSP